MSTFACWCLKSSSQQRSLLLLLRLLSSGFKPLLEQASRPACNHLAAIFNIQKEAGSFAGFPYMTASPCSSIYILKSCVTCTAHSQKPSVNARREKIDIQTPCITCLHSSPCGYICVMHAAGSYARVYRGVYKGSKVAVKIVHHMCGNLQAKEQPSGKSVSCKWPPTPTCSSLLYWKLAQKCPGPTASSGLSRSSVIKAALP